MAWALAIGFLRGLCAFLAGGAATLIAYRLYEIASEYLDRSAADDPFSDAPHGDWVTLPADFEIPVHHGREE